MGDATELRVRRSLTDLQKAYEAGDKKPLETVMQAWKGIKELPPSDPNSFFMIGGYGGERLRGAGWASAAYWGGQCNHGNVLLPHLAPGLSAAAGRRPAQHFELRRRDRALLGRDR